MNDRTEAAQARLTFAVDTAKAAGAAGMAHFSAVDALKIERKGHQDMVSNADREVEQLVRRAIGEAFPDDGVIGEEFAETTGTSGYTWIMIRSTAPPISSPAFRPGRWCSPASRTSAPRSA